jgi:hypothetical protein
MSFSCGIFISKFPAKAESVGLAESVSNFIMLVLAFWLTLQNFIGGIIDGTEVSANPFTLNVVLNVVSSGSVFLLSFYNNPIILRMTKDNDKKFRIKK